MNKLLSFSLLFMTIYLCHKQELYGSIVSLTIMVFYLLMSIIYLLERKIK